MEFINQLIAYFSDKGISKGVAIAYIIVGVLLAIMTIVAIVMRIIVVVRYFKSNRKTCASGISGPQAARYVLDQCGLTDVQVKKSGFFRALFFGNSYSVSRKTIFLRRTIWEKNSLTAVGIALQKVGVAKMCADGKKSVKVRYYCQLLGLFGPVLFIPIILIGVVIDMLLYSAFGTFSIVSIAISLAILLTGFIVTLLNIPIEKKANEMALEMIEESNFCSEEERQEIKKIFDTYLIAYICEFIIEVLRMVQLILEIVMRVQSSNNGK